LSEFAFNLSNRLVTIDFTRSLGSPPADIPSTGLDPDAITRLTNAVVHELCRPSDGVPGSERGRPPDV
jgi:hypothetical protein